MPTNANILLVRHAEQPDSGTGLAPAGQARAQAYVVYFQNYAIGGNPVKPQYIFAAADSDESHRPRLTMEPLAQALGLSIDDKHKDKDYPKVADDLLTHPRYDGSTSWSAGTTARSWTLPPPSALRQARCRRHPTGL